MPVTQSFPTLCSPMDCSPPGSSAPRISQARIFGVGYHALLQGISWLGDGTQVSWIADRFFTIKAKGKLLNNVKDSKIKWEIKKRRWDRWMGSKKKNRGNREWEEVARERKRDFCISILCVLFHSLNSIATTCASDFYRVVYCFFNWRLSSLIYKLRVELFCL